MNKQKRWIKKKMRSIYLISIGLCLSGLIPGLLNKLSLIEIIVPVLFIMFICSLFIPLYWCSVLLDSLNIN